MRERIICVAALAVMAAVMASGQEMPGGGRHTSAGYVRGDSSGAPEFKEKGVWFGRPAKDTPEEQLEHALSLAAKGGLRAATKAFNALVKEWPASDEAKKAQLKVAEMCLKRGNPRDAFGEYQYFIEMFTDAGDADFKTALGLQFAIANDELAKLVRGGWSAPDAETVADMYRRIVSNAPDWDKAAECQFKRGACYEMGKLWFDAAFAYEALVSRFPHSEFKADALFRSAFARVNLSDKQPRDERTMRNAIQSLRDAFNNDKTHDYAEAAVEKHDKLMSTLAKMNFEKAAFYDRIRKNPKAAVIAYEAFAKEFAGTPEAGRALARAEELKLEIRN